MRNRQIDILRAWGIILVVAGHTGSPFKSYIYTFHMPLFFFISGFLRYERAEDQWSKFISKKLKTALIPYVAFWVVSMIIYRQVVSWISPTHRWVWITLDEVKGLLLGGHWLAEHSNNFPLWYLQLFFIASILFEIVARYFNMRLKIVTFFTLIFATIPFQTLLPGRPVFHINVLPAALVFMLMGYFLHSFKNWSSNCLNDSISVSVLLLVSGWKFSTLHYGNISQINSIWYFVGAFCTICGYYIICEHFSRCTVLTYIGEKTLYIMGLHSLTNHPSAAVSAWLIQSIGFENIFLENSVTVFISLLMSCGVAELYNNSKRIVLKKCQGQIG